MRWPTLSIGVLALTASLAWLPPALLGPVPALAAPEPEPIPRRWQLRVDPGPLRVTTIDVPGVGPRAYLYMTFKVTNNTGEDRDFAPSFELATDTGLLLRSGRDVPPAVVQKLLERIDNPLLLDELSVQGRLLQGPENAREGLVVWPAADMSAGEYSVFLSGFSGETKQVVRPDNGQTHLLRKTLLLRHTGTGILDPNSGTPIPRAAERWILR